MPGPTQIVGIPPPGLDRRLSRSPGASGNLGRHPSRAPRGPAPPATGDAGREWGCSRRDGTRRSSARPSGSPAPARHPGRRRPGAAPVRRPLVGRAHHHGGSQRRGRPDRGDRGGAPARGRGRLRRGRRGGRVGLGASARAAAGGRGDAGRSRGRARTVAGVAARPPRDDRRRARVVPAGGVPHRRGVGAGARPAAAARRAARAGSAPPARCARPATRPRSRRPPAPEPARSTGPSPRMRARARARSCGRCSTSWTRRRRCPLPEGVLLADAWDAHAALLRARAAADELGADTTAADIATLEQRRERGSGHDREQPAGSRRRRTPAHRAVPQSGRGGRDRGVRGETQAAGRRAGRATTRRWPTSAPSSPNRASTRTRRISSRSPAGVPPRTSRRGWPPRPSSRSPGASSTRPARSPPCRRAPSSTSARRRCGPGRPSCSVTRRAPIPPPSCGPGRRTRRSRRDRRGDRRRAEPRRRAVRLRRRRLCPVVRGRAAFPATPGTHAAGGSRRSDEPAPSGGPGGGRGLGRTTAG